MTGPANENARRQPGVKTTHLADIAVDSAGIVAESQPIKPEIDLEYARQHHADRKHIWREAACCIALGLLRLGRRA